MWISVRCTRTGHRRLINLQNVTSILYNTTKITYNMEAMEAISYMYKTPEEVLEHYDIVKKGLKHSLPFIPFDETDDEDATTHLR